MNFDDLPDGQPPTPDDNAGQSSPPVNFDDIPDFDDLPDEPQKPQLNTLEAAGVNAASNAAPTVGGIGGAAMGAGIGSVAGPIGSVAGGIAGGLGAGWLTKTAQDWLLDKLGMRDTVSEYEQAAHEQHPIASDIGGAIPIALGAAFNPAATLASRLGSAAVMGGVEGGQQLATGNYDPYAILTDALAGAAAPGMRPWASRAENAGARLGAKFKGTGTGAIQSQVATDPGTPGRPDLDTSATQAAGGGVDEDEFEAIPSKEQTDAANDITKVAQGVAEENPSAPVISGVGNPVGAPMLAREAAKPNDPQRNYGKGAQTSTEGISTQTSTALSTAPIHEDIAAALTPHDQQVAQQSAPPTALDPLDVSQAQRQAVQNVQDRMAGEQQGEAFQPEQPGTLNPDRPAQPASKDVTAPVTTGLKFDDLPHQAPEATPPTAPHEAVDSGLQEPSDQLKSLYGELDKNKLDAVSAKLKSLPLADQEKAVSGVRDFLGTQAAADTKKAGRPTVGNVQARSSKDLARKQGALDAIKTATQKFLPETESVIPTTVNAKAALVDRLKGMVEHATKINGGVEPTSAYKPRVKPPEWQLLRSAQRVIAKPTPKNIRDYVTAENLLRGGGADAAKDVQDTARIEGDITNKPSELGGVEVAAPQGMTHEHYDMLPRQEGKDNSFVDQANNLRDYVNNLSDQDFQTVAGLYDHPGELRSEIEDVMNPDEVLSNFKQAIADTTGKRPGRMELVSPEDAPVASRTKITNAADLAATEPGAAASAGRSLKGTPEFERLAAQYGGVTAPDRAGRLESEEASAKNPENTSGAWAEAGKQFKAMMKDNSGSGKEFPLMRWMMKRTKDAMSPDADKPTTDYISTLPHQFQGMVNRIKNMQMNLRANVLAAANFKLTPEEKTSLYRAQEDNAINTLPKELQGYYQTIEAPMRDRYNAIMRDLQDLDEKHDLGLDLPKMAEGVASRFVPRVRAGKQAWDMADETNVDPVTGKTLSNFAGTLQDRDFFALQPVDKNGDPMAGQRLLVKPSDDGWSVIRNGAPQNIKNLGAGFEGNVGDPISLSSKKTGAQDYKLDHATVREIGANVKDANGQPVDYHENSTLAWAQALDSSQAALERMRLLASIKENPEFIANSTVDKNTAKDRGYELTTTSLPQFQKRSGRDLYMPDDMRWAMDDFNARGYTGRGWDQANSAAAALIKPMYFFGPALHALNETDKWVTSRGFDWVPGTGGYKSLAKTGYDAVKDVNTQGPIQRLIRENGGNPMSAHAITRDLVPQFAKALGEDISTNPSKWDPLAKLWGVNTKDLARSAYNASSKPMWVWSDYLLTQKVMENMSRYNMEPKDAVADAQKWIDDYQMPTTVGPHNQAGRVISKALSTPSISLFGPYHYGLFKTLGSLTKDVVKTPANIKADGGLTRGNTRAIGQLLAGAAVVWGLYPLLDKASQAITGNDKATFGRRGLSQIVSGAQDIATGNKPKQALNNDLFTPSIPLNMGVQALQNRDYRGKAIVEQGAGPVQSAIQGADWAAREAIPPYSTMSSALTKPDASVGSVIGHEVASQVGVHLPSDKEVRYNDRMGKNNEAAMRARTKAPQGAMEELYNSLTR